MKRLFLLLLALCCLAALGGCGSRSASAPPAPPPPKAELAGKKVLVAYFSYGGQTEQVAKVVQAKTKGDLFRIETITPYPSGYRDCIAYAKEEKQRNGRPAIKPGPARMEDYQVVLLGFPIWWYDAPMAVYTFLEQHDMRGKIVISFCTSGGSPISESSPGLRKALAQARFYQGLRLYASDEEGTQKWLEGLGY